MSMLISLALQSTYVLKQLNIMHYLLHHKMPYALGWALTGKLERDSKMKFVA